MQSIEGVSYDATRKNFLVTVEWSYDDNLKTYLLCDSQDPKIFREIIRAPSPSGQFLFTCLFLNCVSC